MTGPRRGSRSLVFLTGNAFVLTSNFARGIDPLAKQYGPSFRSLSSVFSRSLQFAGFSDRGTLDIRTERVNSNNSTPRWFLGSTMSSSFLDCLIRFVS